MTPPLEQRLADAGTATHQAHADQMRVAKELRREIRAAAKRGWTKVRIAQVAGVSRQTVHEILKEER